MNNQYVFAAVPIQASPMQPMDMACTCRCRLRA